MVIRLRDGGWWSPWGPDEDELEDLEDDDAFGYWEDEIEDDCLYCRSSGIREGDVCPACGTFHPLGRRAGEDPPQEHRRTLAHHGVLFLDELTEFRRDAVEGLRHPLLGDTKIGGDGATLAHGPSLEPRPPRPALPVR